MCSASSGFLTSTDDAALLSAAVGAGAVIRLDRLPGDLLIVGTPIASAWPIDTDVPLDAHAVEILAPRVTAAVHTGFERTSTQDIAFGLRQLVVVAVKALSPGINDPTTAVHAVGHIAALLCAAAGRDLGPRLLCDDDGRVRVVLRRPDLAELLELAVAQPRRCGATDPEVLARLLTLLREVAWSTRESVNHDAVTGQLHSLQATIARQDFDEAERVRLDALARSVPAALAGRWSMS